MANTNDTTKDVYRQNGYRDRCDYLESIADEYGMDMMVVGSIAEILGENEDFDELICALEDFPRYEVCGCDTVPEREI